MATTDPSERQQAILASPLLPGGKLDTATTMRLAYGFATAAPVKATAAANGVSQKTVRAFYLECRSRLYNLSFRPWHRLSMLDRHLPDYVTRQSFVRSAFFGVLAACHENETCHRNYRLGNRQSRFCRNCPLPKHFSDRIRQVEAVRLVTAIQDFYRQLGMRKETGTNPIFNFRDRILHLAIISMIRAHTATRADGSLDPADMSDLSLGRFLLILMDDLAGKREDTGDPEADSVAQPSDPPATTDNTPELVDWLLDDGTVIWLPVGEKPPR